MLLKEVKYPRMNEAEWEEIECEEFNSRVPEK